MSAVEWFQGECQFCFWKTSRWQRVHWCNSGLWGWSADGCSQSHLGFFKSILWENFSEKQTPSPSLITQRVSVKRFCFNSWFPIFRRGKCLWTCKRLHNCENIKVNSCLSMMIPSGCLLHIMMWNQDEGAIISRCPSKKSDFLTFLRELGVPEVHLQTSVLQRGEASEKLGPAPWERADLNSNW